MDLPIWINIMQYLQDFKIYLTFIPAFIITFLLGPKIIPLLQRLKASAHERDDGPASHLKKTGTPVMGGVMFLISVTLVSLFFVKDHREIVPVLILYVGFGLVGFADDFIKTGLHRSLGLRAWQKLLLQAIVTGLFLWTAVVWCGIELTMKVPFMGINIDLGILKIPGIIFVILGTVNGVNFTDGVDGLCGSVTAFVAAFFALAAAFMGSGTWVVSSCVAGALLAYLFFNVHPARVFMGDTGSLALGGFVAGTACVMGLELYIPLCGFIYLIEVLSVIIQVGYFKASHGKRIFRMAPIHHHFELSGWEETRVVMAFTIITVLLCMVAFLGL